MSYHVLCIDDDAEFLLTLKIQLKKNYKVSTAQSLAEGLRKIADEGGVDLVLLDVRLGAENGLDGLREIRKKFPATEVVMMSGQRDPKLIVSAVRDGAADYLCKPFATDELLAVIEKTEKLGTLRERHDALIMDMNAKECRRPLIGLSGAFRELMKRAECVKGHGANVLIEGESGTGKELLARHVHELEGNPNRPFIAVNCAAIPDTLIESELFGHEKGAFSGAFQRKVGKFELANGGDIFLDEINSLKPELQAKILRVIQEKEIYRVGGTSPVKIEFRVIAASNANLDEMVTRGSFRMDLYHRLRVVTLSIPPLRERPEDIPELTAHFFEKHGVTGKRRLGPGVMEKLKSYPWPGNVRELENLMHSLLIMSSGTEIRVADLPEWLNRAPSAAAFADGAPAPAETAANVMPLKIFVQKAERDYIRRVLTIKGGDKNKAAELLGISRTSLYDKIRGAALLN